MAKLPEIEEDCDGCKSAEARRNHHSHRIVGCQRYQHLIETYAEENDGKSQKRHPIRESLAKRNHCFLLFDFEAPHSYPLY